MWGSKLALSDWSDLKKEGEIILPSCEDLATIRTRVAEVFNALVDYLDMAVKVTFLAEDFIALGTCRGLVDLDV